MKGQFEFTIVPECDESGYGSYPFVHAFIGKKKLKLLIDTGASMCYMCKSSVDKSTFLQSKATLLPEKDRISLYGIHGKSSVEDGFALVNVPITLGGYTTKINFHIANIDLFGCDGLIGVDFMEEKGFIIDVGSKKITFNAD